MNRRITYDMMGGNVDERIFRRTDITDEQTIQSMVGSFEDIDLIKSVYYAPGTTRKDGYIVQNEDAYSNYYVGDKKLYQTFYRENRMEPWQYAGLCEHGKHHNQSPRTAKRIFIISPFHGETLEEQNFNVDFTREIARTIYLFGDLPVAPHLYFPIFMHDEGHERAWGIEAGHMLMDSCDEAWIYVIDGKVSEGMREDLEYATDHLALPVQKFTWTRTEAEEYLRSENETDEWSGTEHR